MLFCKHAGAERVLRIVVEHGHGGLRDDRAAVRAFIDEMDRAAADLDAIGENVAMRMRAGEARQQRRVDVEDAAFVMTYEERRQDAHETGEHDEHHAFFLECSNQRLFEGLAAVILLAVDAERRDAGFLRAFERIGIRLVGEDDADLCMHLSPVDCVDDGLKIRAAARSEDAENLLRFLSHGTRRL